jgi:hypothetical protein
MTHIVEHAFRSLIPEVEIIASSHMMGWGITSRSWNTAAAPYLVPGNLCGAEIKCVKPVMQAALSRLNIFHTGKQSAEVAIITKGILIGQSQNWTILVATCRLLTAIVLSAWSRRLKEAYRLTFNMQGIIPTHQAVYI